MEAHQDLTKILNSDEDGIAVFSGQELMKIHDYSGGYGKPYSGNRCNPLPNIINVLGDRSSKVILYKI